MQVNTSTHQHAHKWKDRSFKSGFISGDAFPFLSCLQSKFWTRFQTLSLIESKVCQESAWSILLILFFLIVQYNLIVPSHSWLLRNILELWYFFLVILYMWTHLGLNVILMIMLCDSQQVFCQLFSTHVDVPPDSW